MSGAGLETLRDVVAAHAARDPAAPLLIAPDNVHEPGRTLTYGELDRQARRLASFLRSRGIASGDKVALFLENGYQTTLLFLGTMIAGYVVAPLNLRAHRRQLAYCVDHCDAAIVFTEASQAPRLRDAVASASRPIAVEVIDVDARDVLPDGEPAELPAVVGEAPALLMYTSGTTGTPKGVVLTHRNLLAAARQVAAWHGLTRDDRVLSSLPLYHINGQVIATVTPFVSGGSIVAPHRFSVTSWWQDVERHRCTWINMVPTIIAYLLNAAADRAPPRLEHVRFGRSASAPLPPEQHRAFEKLFAIPVIEGMGMTESASLVFCNPMELARRKYGSVGLPCGVIARVAGPDGVERPDGETGEIQFRGANVMAEYYKAPERTAEAVDAEGWLRTGDLGHRDGDGFYFVTGRIKELIIKGGENIAPREIDEVLLAHPAILEAAAVGIPDIHYGQDILAAIVLKPGAACDESALRAYCLAELGRYKTPKSFRFVAELPKGPSGKVQRLALLDTATG
ncbi:MAG: AMP-binding protein [Alphaproteobacteria bacterium]|nr:AMP-binding protein [Alphaproteobacteria bacterium]